MSVSSSSASLTLHTQFNAGTVDRRVFGGFLEHLGRAVYEGIYDPGNPLSDANGFRRDVLDALRPLGFSVMRYPGGNYVSAADWKDGVGPKEKRPRRPDFAWRSIESNQFGTDEFMQWCKQLGTEPMMAVNLGTLGATEAAQLIEYCNLPGGTYWSDRRRQNGHAEPYGVKLWCLGNEMDGPWQAGHVPADVYAQRAFAASVMMKGIDPTIETIACGTSDLLGPTYLQWDRTLLEYCWDKIDYLSAHMYSGNNRDDSPWFLAEGVAVDRLLEDYDGVINYVRGRKRSNKTIGISFDEWNVWYRARSGDAIDGHWAEAPHLLEEVYNLEDALVCAQYLAAFVRRSDLVKIGCLAQIVNVIAPILTNKDGVLIQSIYWPFEWFSKYSAGRTSLTPSVRSPLYTAGERGDVPALDAAAAYDEASGSLAVFLTNRSNQPLPVTVDLTDKAITRFVGGEVLAGRDLKAANSFERPDTIKPASISGTIVGSRLHLTLPATSFACIRAEA